MKDIIKLETALKANAISIKYVLKTDNEFRLLTLRQSILKDLLLEAYRKEVINQSSDIESLTEIEGIPC